MTPFWDSNSVHIKELYLTKKGVHFENRRNYNRNSHQNQGRFAKTQRHTQPATAARKCRKRRQRYQNSSEHRRRRQWGDRGGVQERCEVSIVSERHAVDSSGWANEFDVTDAGEVRAMGRILDAVQECPCYPNSQNRYLKSWLHPKKGLHPIDENTIAVGVQGE